MLETTAANVIQLRSTSVFFQQFSVTYPTLCAGGGSSPGSSTETSSAFRFTTTVGAAVSGTFCSEGSVILATVTDTSIKTHMFRCQRYSGNANVCQKID